MKVSEIITENQLPTSLPPPNDRGWIEVGKPENWYDPQFYVKPTAEGLLMGADNLEGYYADQDGGETGGSWGFTANLTTGEIKIDAVDFDDQTGGYADADGMYEEAKEMVEEFVRKYGRTIDSIEDTLNPAVMGPDED